jgi:hypothetical protein
VARAKNVQRKPPLVNSNRPKAEFLDSGNFAAMNLKTKTLTRVFGVMSAAALIQTTALADDQTALGLNTSNISVMPDTRYGLFNGLDHRSWYSEGDFPEPFLVDDSGLEINEARLDWLHTTAGSQHNDTVTAEVEKGFGNLTLEIEVPYERDVSSDGTAQGIGNIDLGARYPFYQYVSRTGYFDTTFGGAIEVGIPASSAISVNPEFVPKIFNDTKIGDHFTMQSIFGYSTLTGGGAGGGLQTFEYGFTFGYFIDHKQLPLPGVQRFIPMFELVGETPLNKEQSGQNSLLGNACFRLNLNPIKGVQPRLGMGYIFPLNNNARTDVHGGIVISLVFEY